MLILGIETSCDETALALLEASGPLSAPKFRPLENIVSSQIAVHTPFGGVVPSLAKREHIKNLPKIFDNLKLKTTHLKLDAIAVTVGPGLEPALWAGIEYAKQLHKELQKQNPNLKLIGVNHLEGHLFSFLLPQKTNRSNVKGQMSNVFPAIALIVSGGHTILLKMDSLAKWKKLGETVDDAAGEAFDKVSQLLKLGYPGGPIVSAMAERGDAKAFKFPRPMIQNNNFNFSFSGLKTAVLYASQKFSPKKLKSYKLKANLCASFQQAVVEVLRAKTIKAAKYYNAKTIMLSGGVAANQLLRQTLEQKTKKMGLKFLTPKPELCTDNAAMIAAAAFFTKPTPWQKIKVDPNLSL